MTKLESIFKEAFGKISGGKILDVATGQGGFIGVLKDNLKGYTEIIGVDIEEPDSDYAKEIFSQDNIHFFMMDAARLEFDDASFDTVNISSSLHHLTNVPQVLAEMDRVLKPGGYFIITEMHRDGRTEAQISVTLIHHWAAEADSSIGTLHFKTLSRQEIIDHVEGLDLENYRAYDYSDSDSDPMDTSGIQQTEDYIEKRLKLVKKISNYQELKSKVDSLRQRLHQTGRQREPVLIVVGKKFNKRNMGKIGLKLDIVYTT